jgi:hypothetical protein
MFANDFILEESELDRDRIKMRYEADTYRTLA